MSDRPSVDVVVPFAGSRQDLVDLLARLNVLRLTSRDTLTVVDNRPADAGDVVDDHRVVRAPELQSPDFARNAGAAQGNGEWIIFIDSDVEPSPELADLYFASGPPDDDVAVLAGAIHDLEPEAGPSGRQPAAARHAFLKQAMAQTNTRAQLGPFAKTANAAVRRSAFSAIGGFRGNLRSGEDVDLCYRLSAAGWRLEFRDEAIVKHRGRQSVWALLAQQTRHGAGTAWLDTVYPGFSPNFRWISLWVSLARGIVKSLWFRARGDRDRALIASLDPLTALAFHLGRLRRNVLGPPHPLAPSDGIAMKADHGSDQ